MELKKNPKLDLSKYYTLFLSIGLVISIGMVLIAFEWKTLVTNSEVNLEPTGIPFDEILDIELTIQSSPPPPKITQPKIVEIPDEEEIVEAIEIDLDIEMTDESVVEELVIAEAPNEEIADEVFTIVEVMPSYPGGNTKFYEYVSKNLKYPRRALKANVEGKVIVQFLVAQNGDISEIEILKGIGFDCDEEAIRVLESSPKWIPGQHQGRNVKVKVTLPLTFNI